MAPSTCSGDERASVIGVIVPDVADPSYCQTIRGAEAAASQASCFVAAASSDNDIEREARLASMMLAADVDGLLIVASRATADRSHFGSAVRQGKPVVYLSELGLDVGAHGAELLLERMNAATPALA